jgi:hypothetical protein
MTNGTLPANQIHPKVAAGGVSGTGIGIPLSIVVVYLLKISIPAFNPPEEVVAALGALIGTASSFVGGYLKKSS